MQKLGSMRRNMPHALAKTSVGVAEMLMYPRHNRGGRAMASGQGTNADVGKLSGRRRARAEEKVPFWRWANCYGVVNTV